MNSALLRLPAELRLKIWAYSLGGHDLVITSNSLFNDPLPKIYVSIRSELTLNSGSNPRTPNHLLSLTLVCRQIYAETHPLMPFSLNTFHFFGLCAYHSFVAYLSQAQRDAVREIVFGIFILHWYLLQAVDLTIKDKLPGLEKIVVVAGAFSSILMLGWGGVSREGGMDYAEGERRFVRTIREREGENVDVVFRGNYPKE